MLTHQVSTVPVFQTDQYKNFEMIEGNRPLNERKIRNIIKEIESGNDMLQYYPINVKVNGNKLIILDGQHRFFISKKLKRPVYYILVVENKSMRDIARVNSNVEKWTNQNFINCYVAERNKNYIQLKEFYDTYGINIGTSLRLLTTGTPGVEGSDTALTEKFQTGLLEVTKWNEAVMIAENCKRFSDSPFWRDRGFVIAIYRIMKAGKVSIADIFEAYKKYPDLLVKNPSHKTYVYNLEQIFNNKKHNRVVII